MKKTLLITAAALVVGVITSEAQAVYSANIVGYVNTIAPATKFSLISNPLDNGTNSLKSVFPAPPGGTQIQLWTGSGFNIATYTAAGGGHWKTNSVIADDAKITPGTGFFILPGGSSPYTNTFVGNVIPNSGASVTNVVGSGFQLVGSVVPYADYVTNAATINLKGLPGGTQLQAWNFANQSFDIYTYTLAAGGTWKLNGIVNVPQIGVGQGLFLSLPSTYNWVQSLQ